MTFMIALYIDFVIFNILSSNLLSFKVVFFYNCFELSTLNIIQHITAKSN